MSLLTLLVIIFGIYNILHLSANQITQDILSIVNKEKTISKKALLAQGKVKPSKLEKAIREYRKEIGKRVTLLEKVKQELEVIQKAFSSSDKESHEQLRDERTMRPLVAGENY